MHIISKWCEHAQGERNSHHQTHVMDALATTAIASTTEEDSVTCFALRIWVFPGRKCQSSVPLTAQIHDKAIN